MIWGHLMTMGLKRVQGPSVPSVGKPLSDASPHLYPLGRAEGTEDTFATGVTADQTQRQVGRGWGQVPSEKVIKKICVVCCNDRYCPPGFWTARGLTSPKEGVGHSLST